MTWEEIVGTVRANVVFRQHKSGIVLHKMRMHHSVCVCGLFHSTKRVHFQVKISFFREMAPGSGAHLSLNAIAQKLLASHLL